MTDAEIAELRLKARLFDEMAQGILDDFPDIIRSEWNTQTPGGGLPGCVEGALRERQHLLAERDRLREALNDTLRDWFTCDDPTARREQVAPVHPYARRRGRTVMCPGKLRGRKHRWRTTYFGWDPPFRQCKRCGLRQRLRLADPPDDYWYWKTLPNPEAAP